MNISPLRTALILGAIVVFTLPLYAQYDEVRHLMREDDPEYKRERQEWMDAMHRTEPGVDYRLLNAAIRESKKRARQQSGTLGSAFRKEGDTAIGGYLRGYWEEKGSANQAGRTHTADIDFERGLMYIGSAGGNVWRGTIDGKGWRSLNDEDQYSDIRMIRILKAEGLTRIVVVCNSPSRVMYSDDDGDTWQRATGLENAARWGSLRRGMVLNSDEQTMFILANEWEYDNGWGSRAGLYRSDDLGASFKLIKRWEYDGTNSGHFDIWTPRYGRPELFVSHVDTISRLVKDSLLMTEKLITTSTPVASYRNIIMQGFDHGDSWSFYYFMNVNGDKSEIQALPAGTETWEIRGDVPLSPFRQNSFAVSTASPDTMFCGGVETYRSYDGGTTWTRVNKWGQYYGNPASLLHADIPEISCFQTPEGEELIHIATDGGTYLSTDHLMTVQNVSLKGLNVSQYYAVYTNRNNMAFIYAGAQDQGFQRCSNDSGQSVDFDQLISGDYGHICSSNGGTTLWSDYPSFIHVYINSTKASPIRKTWSFDGNKLWLPPIIADPSDPAVAYAAVGGTGNEAKITRVVYDSTLNKLVPELMPFDFAQGEKNTKVSSIGISEYDTDRYYVITNNGKFYTSPDGGTTWQFNEDFDAMGGHYFYGSNILPSRLEEGRVIIAGSGYNNPAVYVSSDFGTTFAPMDSGLPNTLVYDITQTADERFYFAATAVGPYVYITDQGRWYDLGGDVAPDQTYWWVDFVDGPDWARFATYGRGIWDFKISEVVSVRQPPVAAAVRPELTAYPNPSRSGTSFTFNVPPGASPVLRVYDMLGKVVYEAPEGAFTEGSNTIRWDGVAGSQVLPSGTYMAILSYNGMAGYSKVVLTE